jgi:hypothetical protein
VPGETVSALTQTARTPSLARHAAIGSDGPKAVARQGLHEIIVALKTARPKDPDIPPLQVPDNPQALTRQISGSTRAIRKRSWRYLWRIVTGHGWWLLAITSPVGNDRADNDQPEQSGKRPLRVGVGCTRRSRTKPRDDDGCGCKTCNEFLVRWDGHGLAPFSDVFVWFQTVPECLDRRGLIRLGRHVPVRQ